MVAMSTESISNVSPLVTKSIQPVATPVPDSSPTETSVPNIQIPSNELQTESDPSDSSQSHRGCTYITEFYGNKCNGEHDEHHDIHDAASF